MRAHDARKAFFDVPLKKVPTSQGTVELPILYQDFGYIHFLFWADYEKAAAKLADTAFVPCRFFHGKAGVMLTFFQYRTCAIGPYNEVALSIAAHPKGLERAGPFLPQFLRDARDWTMGAYVIDLPVTTAIAEAGGKEIWGYPKFVTSIAFDLDGRRFRGVVDDPDLKEPLVTLEGNSGLVGTGPLLSTASFISHTTQQGVPLRIRSDVDARFAVSLGFSGPVKVNERSQHRMARNLLEVGLQAKKPFLTMHCEKARMILNEGVPIGQPQVARAAGVA
jgi:Acetoacetate decarboxylase (ADC)